MTVNTGSRFDYVLVGGGLQSALLALALRARMPERRIALVEQSTSLGGNHVWCFHVGDVEARSRTWLAPLVSREWPAYRVKFPGMQRRVDHTYTAIRSERLHEVVMQALSGESRVLLGCAATSIAEDAVQLSDGTRLEARAVLDARGPAPSNGNDTLGQGYQKFLGLEFETTQPHGIELPVLMDATVEQTDGFRFMYVLPFSPTRVLLEDTRFSNAPALDRDACREAIRAYAARSGIGGFDVVREEEGVLPMPWNETSTLQRRGPLRVGYRGGFFHPATGYSLAVAARLAEHIASRSPSDLFDTAWRDFVRTHRRQAAFCRRLNAMLFQWFPPQERWHVFQRFYGLPLETIERFYALRLRRLDQGRLVLGRPPRGLSVRYRLSQGATA